MIYLYHIRKCGGRSLIFSILGTAGNAQEMWASACRGNDVIVDGKAFSGSPFPDISTYFAWSHAPYNSVVIPGDAFTITTLRDPVKRVVSYYTMLRMYEAGAAGNDSVLREEYKYLDGDMLDFVVALPRERLLRQLYMFSETFSVWQATERINSLSHHFTVENYAQGLAALSEKLGLPLREYRISDPGKNATISARVASELPRAQDTLRTLLEPEYKLMEALGYG